MAGRIKRAFDPQEVARGIAHLEAADPVMGALIGRVGPFALDLEPDPFRMLVRSVISQQISTKAAHAIRLRLEERHGRKPITAASLQKLGPDELRAVGLSGRKAEYLLDLALRITDKSLSPGTLHKLPDAEVINQLIAVRGIGVWTAQMLLIFCLGRFDVLPEDDYGVRVAIRNLYALPELPTRVQCRQIAAPWRPYATLASWYCWRSLDNSPGPKAV